MIHLAMYIMDWSEYDFEYGILDFTYTVVFASLTMKYAILQKLVGVVIVGIAFMGLAKWWLSYEGDFAR